ncbi:MAG: hypothetical protein NTV38_12915 [Chloroflexi bacterium]|nr:hypothetical protein [Chloroflexota bacterium]
MIWHDHERVHFHIWEMDRDFAPTFLHDLPQRIHPHLATYHLAKQ